MNCRTFRKQYVELLDLEPQTPLVAELRRHMAECPACAAHFAAIGQTLPLLTSPSRAVQPTQPLKESIMNRIMEMESLAPVPVNVNRPRLLRLWRPALAVAALLAIAALAAQLRPPKGSGGTSNGAGLSLIIAQAAAAEREAFRGPDLVHLVNEITVAAVKDPELARLRWLPLMLLEPDGKPNLSRLELPAAPGERYTVGDEVWFDPATGRFKRILSREGRAIFATVFDGKAIATYDPARPAGLVPKPVTAAFKIPQNPAEILGIGAGLPVAAEKIKENDWTAAGEEKLADGAAVKLYKAAAAGEGDAGGSDWIFKVRQDDQTLAAMEWRLKGTPFLEIRRVKLEKLRVQKVAWNLDGVPPTGQAGQVAAGGKVGVTPGMVTPGVSVAEMAANATFETYLFAKNPPWTTRRTITSIIDPVSPGQRMFSLVYPAGDHRHVVLVHSPSYNRMLGPMIKMGKMVYQSPGGFKVWSGPRDAWLAGILLQSSQYVTREKPAENRTGYLLESPAGTYPALAVNGPLSEKELHELIDSLVPAKGFKE